ncbi:MAG: DUF4981 domain-containing protein [Clostridiales bacterium]|nr:DUF4981 domain-containing protein [Clostridiales bacterium]
MNKMLKVLFSSALVLCVLFSFAACSNSNDNSEWNNDISTVQRRKSAAHVPLSSYNSLEEAATLSLKDENNANYMSLNGTWDFSFTTSTVNIPFDFIQPSFVSSAGTVTAGEQGAEDMTWSEITVPGVWETQGYGSAVYTPLSRYPWGDSLTPANVPESNEIGLYRRTFEVPEDWDGDRIAISFEGVRSAFYVYINGNFAGYAEDSYTTKDFDITQYVQVGQTNTVAVQVVKYTDGSWIEAADGIAYGGIYRDVYLTAFPENKIMDVSFETILNEDFSNAMLQTTVTLANYTDTISDSNQVRVSIYDADGNLVSEETQIGSVIRYSSNQTANLYYEGEVGGRVSVNSPRLWSAEDPYLYTAVIALYDGEGNLLDVTNQKIGIRSLSLASDDEGNQTLTINGERIVLYGINYNEHDPETGMTLSYEQMLSDVKLMKELNINAVRSPGRSLSTTFLDLCDQYGIYVVDDASVSSYPYSNMEEQSIPGDQSIWQTATLDRLISVMERDKNRASVVLWSIANNSGSGSQINFLKTYLQSNDSRLLIYDGMESATDIMVAYDWNMTAVNEYLEESANRKPMIVQTDALGLLNGAGSVQAYVDLFMNNDAAQGGFLANWVDYATTDGTNLLYSSDLEDGYLALKGILNADRTLQSDAEEFKRAYSPIDIEEVNASEGTFRVTNKNLFTSLENNYVISYEIYAGTELVGQGDVTGLTAAPGESAEFSVPYGNLQANTEYFVDFTVKYANRPVWAESDDIIVTSEQFEITAFATTPKTSESDTSGAAFNVSSFAIPDVTTSAVNIARGQFWFSNSSLSDLNEYYTLSYRIIEENTQTPYMKSDTGEIWESPGAVVLLEGAFADFSVPASSEEYMVTIPYTVNGVSTGNYTVELTLTTRRAIGDIPAGYEIVYLFDQTSLGEKIPFNLDASRTPTPVLDENGEQSYDEDTSYPLMTGGDPIENSLPAYEPKAYFEEYSSFITLDNGDVSITINSDTGLITHYSVGGKDIFSSGANSPIGNFTRQQTGGDILGGYSSDTNTSLLNTISSSTEGKNLVGNVSAERVSDSHWRITTEYALASYPYEAYEVDELNVDYIVVYDIYANGEIAVNVMYDSGADTSIEPYEISNVLTLASGFETMTWFGRGPGESYSDKLAGTRVGLYENVNITDQIEDYLAMAESGNKSDVRWVALRDASGDGIMISSDTSNFDLNVSKWYPWSSEAYSRDSLANETTIVRVIGAARGVNSGLVSESMLYTSGSYINPGMMYSYSYKISPINSSTDLAAKAAERITDSSALASDSSTLSSGTSYSVRSVADPNLYLSVDSEGNILMNAGTGSDNQIWIREDTITMMPNTFTLRSYGMNRYLTAVSYYTNGISAELGLGDYDGYLWQNFLQDNTNELYAAQFYYAVTPVSYDSQFYMGSRVALMPRASRAEAAWEFIAVEGVENGYLIRNSQTGYYLTAANSLTYRNSLVRELSERLRNYAPTVDWSLYSSFSTASPLTSDYSGTDWVETTSTVTQWNILPGTAQKWVFTQSGDGYTIRNSSTGEYIAVSDGNLVRGSNATVFTAREENGKFYLYDADTNLALTVMNSSESGLLISLEPFTGVDAQLWDLVSDSDLEISIEAGDEWFTVGPEQIVEE